MSLTTLDALQGGISKMPRMIYGTAWKKQQTADCVFEALKAGFRGIDTAAMAKHYNEKGVGEGIRRAISAGVCTRADLYIQTKFSPGDEAYADRNMYPTIADQVTSSVSHSLIVLSTPDSTDWPYLDCVVLHSPYRNPADTLQAWWALSKFVPSQVRSLGISNIVFEEFAELYAQEALRPLPVVVQNRFCAKSEDWDAAMRPFCSQRHLRYQAFWTLTANKPEWTGADYVKTVAEGAAVDRQVAWYALMMADNIVVLNGTTDPVHMREDLDGLERVEQWRRSEEGREKWEACMAKFRARTGWE
ncbi:Aldo/keto reductase [Thozetella sp. PMI_491]|nr:Aldo/keto reductase [Thozetella sp. PMI_491]